MVNVGLNYSCPGCNQAVGLLPAGYVCPTTGGTQPGHEPVARRTRPRPVRRAIAGETIDDIIKRLDDRARQAARRPWREPDWDALPTASRHPSVETTWRGGAFPRRGRAGSAPADRR